MPPSRLIVFGTLAACMSRSEYSWMPMFCRGIRSSGSRRRNCRPSCALAVPGTNAAPATAAAPAPSERLATVQPLLSHGSSPIPFRGDRSPDLPEPDFRGRTRRASSHGRLELAPPTRTRGDPTHFRAPHSKYVDFFKYGSADAGPRAAARSEGGEGMGKGCGPERGEILHRLASSVAVCDEKRNGRAMRRTSSARCWSTGGSRLGPRRVPAPIVASWRECRRSCR